ncbi:MAG TPA: helix-turn-helix domain-containing protein [Candidatus Binataceae bacterium]|nr:helix-turn-helix domain-containing protein [Candidatus Binataceae bacterium]
MRRSRLETKRRILDAAYGLFWRQGFFRVAMDDIATRANVTKRTLYKHFPSKDDLIQSVLAHASEFALSRLRQFKRPPDAEDFIDSFFGELSDWAAKPKWSGGGFTRVVVELADLRGHPARSIARQHKAAVERWLTEAIAAADIPSAQQRAREIMLLTEGAMILMLIHGDRSYARAAALAAKALVRPVRLRRSRSWRSS